MIELRRLRYDIHKIHKIMRIQWHVIGDIELDGYGRNQIHKNIAVVTVESATVIDIVQLRINGLIGRTEGNASWLETILKFLYNMNCLVQVARYEIWHENWRMSVYLDRIIGTIDIIENGWPLISGIRANRQLNRWSTGMDYVSIHIARIEFSHVIDPPKMIFSISWAWF